MPRTETQRLSLVADRLDALLKMALIARERPVAEVLEIVAETARETVGFDSVAVNVYRPAWHDYEAVLVLGGEEQAAALLGTTNSYEQMHGQLLLERFERVPGAYFLPAGTAVWEAIDNAYSAPGPDPDDHSAWHVHDGLLVRLTASDGAPLGVVSVDDPVSGRRPDDEDLRLLVAVCSHASLALETARMRAETDIHQRVLERALAFTADLPAGASRVEVLEQACAVARGEIGFESVGAFLSVDGEQRKVAGAGRDLGPWPAWMGETAMEQTEPRLIDAGQPSPCDGAGPHAWQGHLVSMALRRPDGEVVGGLLLGDPTDRLLPVPRRRQELRLLADQVVTALGFADREEHLADLAARDPLTGLRNRRDLEASIGALVESGRDLAVLACDLDHFKSVNDSFGHDVGDRVLERFGALLADHARESDQAIRLGGEEFCLLLPGAGPEGAKTVAERIRAECPVATSDLSPRQTVSIGVACSKGPARTASGLLAAADRALYAAKRGGRDCVRLA